MSTTRPTAYIIFDLLRPHKQLINLQNNLVISIINYVYYKKNTERDTRAVSHIADLYCAYI